MMTACNIGSDRVPLIGRKVLEVIVTSVEEAIEAEQGGADRLEIVRCLDEGGLTPDFDLVRRITATVQLPVRVMLRESNSMSLPRSSELHDAQVDRLAGAADRFAQLQINGLVLGFIRDGRVDESALHRILSAAPRLSITFHRAFEHLDSPLDGLAVIKHLAQIDRILVRIGADGRGVGLGQVKTWQCFVAPEIRFIAGIGLDRALLDSVRDEASLLEVHAGRGARDPETTFGLVSRMKVAQLKSALL